MKTPFHHLRIIEKEMPPSPIPGDFHAPAEEAGIVVTNIYLDDKELHGPFESELRVVYGPDQLTVAYIPVVVASITVEREVADEQQPDARTTELVEQSERNRQGML